MNKSEEQVTLTLTRGEIYVLASALMAAKHYLTTEFKRETPLAKYALERGQALREKLTPEEAAPVY